MENNANHSAAKRETAADAADAAAAAAAVEKHRFVNQKPRHPSAPALPPTKTVVESAADGPGPSIESPGTSSLQRRR